MTDLSQPASVTEGGQTITSTSESVEQIRETMQPPDPEPEPDEDEGEEERPRVPKKVSKAAAELGKRGGEASAEARRAAKEAEDEEADAVAEAEELEKAGKLGKPRHDPRARMLAATREAKAAKAEREAAKAEAETAKRERDALKAEVEKARTAPVAAAPAKEKTEASGKPVPANFATYEEFNEALVDWKARELFTERDAKAAEAAKVAEFVKTIDDALKLATGFRDEFEKGHPDFKASLSADVKAIMNRPSFMRDPGSSLYSDHVISDEFIIAGTAGPPMMVYLSQHPEELQRIRALSISEEIKIEMRILARTLGAASTATSPKREVSKAPQPIRPVTGGPHIDDSDEPDENAPLSAFIKRDNARRAREASR